MLSQLKQTVYQANLDLVKYGLVIFTWGNVSGIDRKNNLVVIKPSGIEYEKMTVNDMVVVDLKGNVVEGKYLASSDTPTHLELYIKHKDIGGIVHTHSTYATAFAQGDIPILPYGTTHADYFYGPIRCTRQMTASEINTDYEKNTGKTINELIGSQGAMAVPACLVASHGAFAWGKNSGEAVHNAVVLEQIAKMAWLTKSLNGEIGSVSNSLMDKHYFRKHGQNAYYGQKDVKK